MLVGGGHSHVHVLKSFGMRPVPGVRLTLVARDVETPYSGMLPGLIAGHYTREEAHIDLRRLARFAGARLVHAEAVGIDREAHRVLCRRRPPVRYDLLSLDIGSTPKRQGIPGAEQHTVPIKPIDGFAARWADILERLRRAEERRRVLVVGGGAAGVEITLAMQQRVRSLVDEARMPAFALATVGGILPHYNVGVRRAFARVLAERGVEIHDDAEVVAVERGVAVCADGCRLGFDEAVWATQAGAADWLKETGLELDGKGFVAVDACLRSVSDPRVFAAGDVASVLPHPREKAGVFAVRQGPPLADNLRRVLAGKSPRPFTPQRRYLSLITTGNRYAVGSRGRFKAEGRWVWRVKDWIDRRWMRQYQELPAMQAEAPAMRCGGCGAKVPAPALARVMRRLGIEAGDDAALLEPPRDALLVQTVDFFRAFVSDPYLFGKIAANHALGDVYAMGGTPESALAIAAVPPGREAVVEEDLYQLLRGGLEVLEAAGAKLVGGHSAEAAELALGFTVSGRVDPARVLRKGGLRPGDRLVLTKPLGTGTLLAAEMRGAAKAAWVEGAIATMLRPAGPAAAVLLAHGATACTDVTGFGLLGHLLEMLRASGADATLDLDAVPVLDGALETLGAGVASTLHPANAALETALVGDDTSVRVQLLFDPQTAGGLLAGVPANRAETCVAALHDAGYPDAAVIGVVGPSSAEPRVRLVARADEKSDKPANNTQPDALDQRRVRTFAR